MKTSNSIESVGQCALQQALRHIGCSYRRIATLTGVSHRTAWQHVAANPGANILAWQDRPQGQREAAIALAQMTLGDGPRNYNQRVAVRGCGEYSP